MNKRTRDLTEIAIGIALAAVCSFICVYKMPQGGSVSMTMVPILLIAFRSGAVSGMLTGGIYGLVSLLIAGELFHPLSILLDYVLAFALVGLAGLFKNDAKGIILGSITGVLGRFLSSYISGVTIFASYAPQGQSPWLYSLIYQVTYLVPELIISAAVLLLLRNKTPGLFERK